MTAWFVLATLLGLLVLLIHGRIRPPLLFGALALLYYALDLLSFDGLMAGFVNGAVITLMVLLMVAVVLEQTGLLGALSRRLVSGSYRKSLVKLGVITSITSAFLNNTAVVAALMGALKNNPHHAPSKLLIPLSYFAILGGTVTLIGTSTNLIVNSFVIEAGLPALGLFDFVYVGLPLAVAGVGLIVFFGDRLLPAYDTKGAKEADYLIEALIEPKLAGKSVAQARLRNLQKLFLVELHRGEEVIAPVSPKTTLQTGDRLYFTGDVGAIQSLAHMGGLKVTGTPPSGKVNDHLVEAIIAHTSTLVGKTLKNAQFRSKFDASVVAIRRGSERLSGQLGRIPLQVGDTLVLATGPDFHTRENLGRNFYLTTTRQVRKVLDPLPGNLALIGFMGVIVLGALGVVPLVKGLMILLALFVLGRLVSVDTLRRRFPFELLIVIVSALAIAKVMQSSGASALVAQAVVSSFGQLGVMGAFAGVFLAAFILTEVVTNNAAAALVFPVGLATAQSFGVDAMPFIMAVAYGASASFLIPSGYQTNLMVYSAGGYRVRDYLRIGLPVAALHITICITLIPLFFPF
jgi:di/tricarboxylate transporter